MGHSYSCSPRREHGRSVPTFLEREPGFTKGPRFQERNGRRSLSRSPHRRCSRSPRRHRATSPSPSLPEERREEEKKKDKRKEEQRTSVTEEALEGKTQKEIKILKLMGFASFDSTKGKKVDGSVNAYAINLSQRRKYKQYMHQKGGFNRSLDFIARELKC